MPANGMDTESTEAAALWRTFFVRGGTLGALRESTPAVMESVYRLGYGHYCSGHYSRALQVFRYLAMLDHRDFRYYLAIGLTLRKLRRNAAAVVALDYASRLNPHDPRAPIAMAEGFTHLGQPLLASASIRQALAITEKNMADWKPERAQAQRLQNSLGS